MPKNVGKGSGGGGAGTQPPKSAAPGGGAVSPANPAPPTPTGVVQAFQAAPGANSNFVNMADMRDRLGGTRAEQDVAILQAVRSGKLTLETHEGNIGALSPRQRDAGLFMRPSPEGRYRGPDGRRYLDRFDYAQKPQ